MASVRDYSRAVLDRLWPPVVDASLREAGFWQPDALAAYCFRCGASAGPGSVTSRGCAFCLDEPIHWDRLTRLAAYDEPVAAWVKAMKFGRQWSFGHFFGTQLAARVTAPFVESRITVCPVPMPFRRRWHRGFNQSALIAEQLASLRGWPCAELLRRTRHTLPQTTVAPSQRPANVRDSFAVRPGLDLTDWEVLLVDDVKTTGSTLSVCARLLKKAGARSVQVAVVAVADPYHQNFQAL